jgi:hypothetical protein
MELLEQDAALRRQTLYPAELRAHSEGSLILEHFWAIPKKMPKLNGTSPAHLLSFSYSLFRSVIFAGTMMPQVAELFLRVLK